MSRLHEISNSQLVSEVRPIGSDRLSFLGLGRMLPGRKLMIAVLQDWVVLDDELKRQEVGWSGLSREELINVLA